eukprot:tig00020848_g14586.t1
MAFKLDPLPFAPTDLEPYTSARTVDFHYNKHHATYVNKLNDLVKGTPDEKKSLEDVIITSAGKNPQVFNNAAQAWNHTFFWKCMKKDGGGEPGGQLKEKIVATWGSFDRFKEEFKSAGIAQFGSGWAWLVRNSDASLAIAKTANAETPLTTPGAVPLLTVDVWEARKSLS